ncbi:type IV pilus biogenesis/stability protein PilW [Lysobacter koreensis]|uniref:Type IV pilus biogenesis/stability protein PilW n=1 Tax=Lysobacter koreensis TaxID=266122 RepID=A0ABW2YL37_9GAMM
MAVLAGLLMASGCSRLDFIRPDTSRKGFESTAPEINLKRKRGGNALAHVQLAQQRLAAGDLAGAQSAAKQGLKLDPRSADAHTVMALALDRVGKPADAGDHYRRAAELAPERGGTLNNYGTWLCSNGRAAESLAWFEQALAAPGYATPGAALANAGACAMQVGQNARAERDLRRAVMLDPDSPVALGALAELEFKAGRAFQARAFSERRLAVAPADPQTLQLASQIEQQLGDNAAAARYVQRIRAEFPDTRGFETGEGGKP